MSPGPTDPVGRAPARDELQMRYERLEAENEDLRRRLRGFVLESEELRTELEGFQSSVTQVLARRGTVAIERLLPYRTRRRQALVAVAHRTWHLWNRMSGRSPRRGSTAETEQRERANLRDYVAWLRAKTPTPAMLVRQHQVSDVWERRPLISICMPVYDPEPEHLDQAIQAVLAQSYDNWELCVCDDASPRPDVSALLARAADVEPRIRVTTMHQNAGISSATNEAIKLASGEYVGFLDDDDLLAPHALFRMVERLQRDPSIDVFYCDEDVLLTTGEVVEPFFKPDWSPELELSMNYVTHFLVVRRALIEELGGLRPERDGAQDHDLVLRVSELTDSICHIPEVLYSWRRSPRSASQGIEAKPWAFEMGGEAIRDALARRHTAAIVEPGAIPGGWRVRYSIPEPSPEVAIVVPTRDRLDVLRPCLESITALTSYKPYSIVVLDNDSKEERTKRYLASHDVNTLPVPGPFNYSAIMNQAFEHTAAAFVLTLNNDTLILDPDWLVGLVELMSQPDVGVVGCRLIFPDGRIQHEGIVIGCGRSPAANLCLDMPGLRLANLLHSTREVSAVTGACSLIRRSAWEAVGGFDEMLGVVYNDVDLCLRIRHAGYRILYTPYVTLAHDESSSRGSLHPMEEQRLFLERWGADVGGDPYFPAALRLGMGGWRLSA